MDELRPRIAHSHMLYYTSGQSIRKRWILRLEFSKRFAGSKRQSLYVCNGSADSYTSKKSADALETAYFPAFRGNVLIHRF